MPDTTYTNYVNNTKQTITGETTTDETIDGTIEDDILVGGDGNDTINGDKGDDIIIGGAGDDDINGGIGDDVIIGGEGDDNIKGSAGDDIVNGGNGDDFIRGGTGDDVLDGGEGNDFIKGDAGNDILNGGNGDDVLISGYGNDIINGDAGDDIIDGGSGSDIMHGGDGNDMIYGMNGNDILYGENGDDIISGGGGNDILYGGNGGDAFIFDFNDGNDVIKDFDPTEDTIEIGGMIGDFEDISISQEGGNVVITTTYGAITIENVNIDDLEFGDIGSGAMIEIKDYVDEDEGNGGVVSSNDDTAIDVDLLDNILELSDGDSGGYTVAQNIMIENHVATDTSPYVNHEDVLDISIDTPDVDITTDDNSSDY